MILISAGHHPYAKGASFKDFNEHDEAKIWVSKIVNLLGHKGMVVPVGILRDKVNFINEQKDVECAIEIHFNSAKDRNGNHIGKGSESLYYPNSDKGASLALAIQDRLGIVYGPDRGIKEGYYRMNKANGPDFFLARTKCTSVIIEPEFVHHAEKIKEGRDAGCKIIAEALLKYCGEK